MSRAVCPKCGSGIFPEIGDAACWWCAHGIKPPSPLASITRAPETLEAIGRAFDFAVDSAARAWNVLPLG